MSTLDATREIIDSRDELAKIIVTAWTEMGFERQPWLNRTLETRKYVTADSTASTEVGSLPWKNKTTIPKLTQIADNLQAYYMAALMPTPDWFIWEGSNEVSIRKARVIEQYVGAKLRQGSFRKELEKVVRDWIIYGNCFSSVKWCKEMSVSKETGQEFISFIGPKLVRLSPIDVIIDNKALSIDKSPCILRTIVPIADVLDHNATMGGVPYEESAIEKIKELRNPHSDWVDWYKETGYNVDGFMSFTSYLDSQYIELLHYHGDIYDRTTGTIIRNQVITIADRSFVLRMAPNPTWSGKKPINHCGWRILPDNLYGQGPLDNLVGMQYRCDHLENLKADAFDQIVHPMIKIKGDDVEDFVFGPGEKIYMGADSDVEFLRPDATVLQCDNQVAMYHNYMELMAGSPREAMGFRTPGEKTAFEVNVLQQGADRQFQDKLARFEEYIIEPTLNMMFELIMRNLDVTDVVRVISDEEDIEIFMSITKDDLRADGLLRPIGAKHFAARNKRVQEMQQFLNICATSPNIATHISGLQTAKMFSEELGLDKWNIVSQNAALKEQLVAQMEIQQMKQAMSQMGMNNEDGSSPVDMADEEEGTPNPAQVMGL